MFENAHGFIVCKGLAEPEGAETTALGNEMWMADRRLHKFINDEVLKIEKDNCFFLDGYVFNKSDICRQQGTEIWQDAFATLISEEKCPEKLRGAFSGFWKKENRFILFVDHIGNKGLYYYCQNDIMIISSNFYYIVELLTYSDITLTVSRQAVRYMLEQGFMLDDTTFANEIKRVCPGKIIEIQDNQVTEERRYFLIDNTKPNYDMSEEEVVEKIDYYFRQAVKREFDKDIEYGYKHLVDLSGGLDSRMTCWCAHQMGYSEQVNFTYCKKGYLDYKIAQEIALKLKHTFLFMPLDDFQWFNKAEEILKKNNGAALYSGITGGYRFLQLLNCESFGIEHTGMVGDAILSTFYSDEKYNYGKPVGDENAYSGLVRYDVPKDVIKGFDNREQFSVYTRGFLGAQSSYLTRQNYLETSSPFCDVDFLNFVFTIPFKLRRRHYIYLKWIESKYTETTEFGWEKWFGIKPKLSNIWMKRILTTKNKYINRFYKVLGFKSSKGMNPYDYWMHNDKNMQKWVVKCFAEHKQYLSACPELEEDIVTVFNRGNVSEKSQALTALIMMKTVLGIA